MRLLFVLTTFFIFGLSSLAHAEWPPTDPMDDNYFSDQEYWSWNNKYYRTRGQVKDFLATAGGTYVPRPYLCGYSETEWSVRATYSNYESGDVYCNSYIQFSKQSCSSDYNSTFCGTDYMNPENPNQPWTDEECEAANGGQQTFTGITLETAEAGFTTSGGACQMAAISETIAWGLDADGNYWVNATWVSSSTGEGYNPDVEEGTQTDFVAPDYMTPTTSDSAFCQTGSCVTIDGQTYHVDQSAIDSGSAGVEETDGIDWGDGSGSGSGSGSGAGSYDGPEEGTSVGADGDPLGAGEGDPDGDGQGDSTLGDVVKTLGGLKSAMRNGLDGIWDKMDETADEFQEEVDPQAVIDGSSINQEYSDLESEHDQYSVDLMGKFDQIGEDGSSPIVDPLLDHVPSMPSAQCSPVVFGNGNFQFTVPCSVFEMFRTWFAWILYAWTAWTLLEIFFSTRRA
ncbi:hypothetical protein LG302_02555 [Halomonas organivorans]